MSEIELPQEEHKTEEQHSEAVVATAESEEQKHTQIEHLQPESNNCVKRVYFTNVPYDISEDDFLEFLKDYQPISVLIPYQYVVKFGGKKTVQPLGVAYADFSTPEVANKVVLEVAGLQVPGKKQVLRVKLFEAYDPKKSKAGQPREHRLISKLKKNFKGDSSAETEEEGHADSKTDAAKAEVPEIHGESSSESPSNETKIPEEEETKVETASNKASPKLSKTWVYVAKLSNSTVDLDLSKHFHEFSPSDIYVFKFRPNHYRNKIFKQVQLSAIMKFPEVEGIDDIAAHVSAKMTNTKLKDSKISVKPSFEKKVTEVVNAAKVKDQKEVETDESPVVSSGSAADAPVVAAEDPVAAEDEFSEQK